MLFSQTPEIMSYLIKLADWQIGIITRVDEKEELVGVQVPGEKDERWIKVFNVVLLGKSSLVEIDLEAALLPGVQIIYTPEHTGGDIQHEDSEVGFVAGTVKDEAVFCRYWRRGGGPLELRTRSSSELTPIKYLHIALTVSQAHVDETLREIARER